MVKAFIRNFLIHLSAIWVTAKLIPGFTYSGGMRSLVIGTLGLMLTNLAVIPLLRVMFLPLNLLTLGLFTWVVNVIALYILTSVLPQFEILPFYFEGYNFNGFIIPATDLNVWQVAVIASFLVGLVSHFLHWLSK